MTVKKRLFWSNILMIAVPAVSTLLVGILCAGVLGFLLLGGTGAGMTDREDFDSVCAGLSEIVEERLRSERPLAPLKALLDGNGMSLTVLRNGRPFYACGETKTGDGELLSAAALLGGDGSLARGGRSLYFRAASMGGQDYQIYIFGDNRRAEPYANIKAGLAASAVLIACAIVLSIFLTNRFLTRFVFRRIERPLDILTNGVHEIRDGNLEYRIVYDGRDEFAPVCEDFNEMAGRLKDSVNRIQRQEVSRRELIAGISHDIRSPLTSIRAYVEGLLDGVAKTPEMQKRYLETIKNKAEDLNHIVSQLFLFSQMELGEYPENPRRLRLDETILNVVSTLREEYAQKGLTVVTELEPAILYADPLQIERITVNLLENSVKYMDKEQGKAIVSLRRQEDGILLSFADDGPGVPPEALPHLFEVFYRSDPAREQPNKGSGLGLAIVANAVRRMGGTAEALAGKAGGLEIRIKFPSGGTEDGENTDCGR